MGLPTNWQVIEPTNSKLRNPWIHCTRCSWLFQLAEGHDCLVVRYELRLKQFEREVAKAAILQGGSVIAKVPAEEAAPRVPRRVQPRDDQHD